MYGMRNDEKIRRTWYDEYCHTCDKLSMKRDDPNEKALLSLHEILVSYALSVLLPQAAFFCYSSRPVVWQLRLVKQLP